MKNLLPLMFFYICVFPPVVYGQSFFDKETKYVVKRYQGESEPDYYTFQEVYSDSIVNATQYYHVLKSVGKFTSKVLYKIKDGKVYVISSNFKNNVKDYHLIYDFNLNAGDSMITDSFYCGCSYITKRYTTVIDSVKTISIGGKSRKVQYVTLKFKQWESYKYTFVEGLGCLETGLIYFEVTGFFNVDHWKCERICINDSAYLPKLKNNALHYLDTPCMNDSLRKIVSIDEVRSSDIEYIYPNPFTDYLIIKNFTGKIYLYDVKGSLILEESIDKQQIMDVNYLEKGVYYIKLDSENNSMYRKVLKL